MRHKLYAGKFKNCFEVKLTVGFFFFFYYLCRDSIGERRESYVLLGRRLRSLCLVFVSCCLVMTASLPLKICTSTCSYFTFLLLLTLVSLLLCEASTVVTSWIFITKLLCFILPFHSLFLISTQYISEHIQR